MGNGVQYFVKRALGLLAFGFAACFPIACGSVTGIDEASARIGSQGQEQTGSAFIRISLGSVAALAKKADTTVTLDTLHIALSSPGCSTRAIDLPVAGNIHSGSLAFTALFDGLEPLRNWNLKAYTRDMVDSLVHIDSTTFFVKPADTSAVSMLLAPKFSILVARFISTSDQVEKIEKLVLKVNGVVVDDTVFSSKRKIFDVKLSHKYVKAGVSTTLLMEAMDKASSNHVKYSKTLTFTPRTSSDSTITVKLTSGKGDDHDDDDDDDD